MHYMFHSLQSQPELELVLVMIVIPAVLNTVQFWITDTFLKQQVPSSSSSSPNNSSPAPTSKTSSYRELIEVSTLSISLITLTLLAVCSPATKERAVMMRKIKEKRKEGIQRRMTSAPLPLSSLRRRKECHVSHARDRLR